MTRNWILATATVVLTGAVVFPTLANDIGTGEEVTGNLACGSRCEDFVVYLEGVPGSFNAEGQKTVFDQMNKVFVPHVLPLLQGTTLTLKNGDPFMHNVHVYQGKKTLFNVAMPFQGMTLDQELKEQGSYVVLCDAHPEMSAYVLVLDNPFFAMPQADGSFSIRGVPPGTYSLVRYDAEKDKTSKTVVDVGPSGAVAGF